MMGSSRRGGGAVFGDPFVMGTGGACRDHVGSVNWDPGALSGVVPDVLMACVCRTARDIEFGRTTLRGAK